MGKANEKIQQKEGDLNPFPDKQSELEYLQWDQERTTKAVTNLEAKMADQQAAASGKPKEEPEPEKG